MKKIYYCLIGILFERIIKYPKKLNLSFNDTAKLKEALELYFDKCKKI
jgi:hypothetical protein